MNTNDHQTSLLFLDSTIPMPLMQLPVRSTCVKLEKGVVLISPGPEILKKITQITSQIGPVTDIVAPSLLHHLYAKRASEAYPKARIWGPQGIESKRKDIRWTHFLGKDPWLFDGELKTMPVQGMPSIKEWVFFHRKTRTLIVSDLCFNLLDVKGLGAKIILSLFGTYQRFGVSRLFLMNVKKRAEFVESMERILQEDFDSIVMGHGKRIESGGKELLLSALRERKIISRKQYE